MTFPLEPNAPASRDAADARDVAPPQFGVDGEQAERDWPLMTHAEVAGVLARIDGVGAPARLTWHSPRPFSAAVLVRTTDERALFVKRHHVSLRDVAGLEEEHRFIAHLRERGVAVADVLAGRDGATAFASGDWTYEVHVVAPGVDAYRGVMSWQPFKHPSHAYAAGRALAELHRASAGYDAPARPVRTLLSSFRVLSSTDLAVALERWVDAQPLLTRALCTRDWRGDVAAAIGPYHARLVPLLPALPPLWTHGDWHASNLLWTDASPGAQVRTVLDFGLSDRTCAVMDVALAIERNTIDWMAPANARRIEYAHIDALLDGYESLEPLSDDAYAALVAMLPIAHTEFALSEVAYFGCVIDAPAIVDIAYDGYLLGHARWFGERDGRQLLDWLVQRRRAKRGRV
ncbi:phosphotransferase enzyme family protein [Burkholderia territorii]|uniref:phosphotransferase enzyme family protein n=1 Tax=Burkholderia territorii TaxID=1503055 RepID=UPI00075758DA|nr:phosphotransferase [Burkholderia territorii]KWO66520.1 aminoglycoside phosphotransferase [Burkholderia territorii]